MKVDIADEIKAVVSETILQIKEQKLLNDDRLAYSEPEAARLLGLADHQLGDERRRGRIGCSRVVGRQVRYTVRDLSEYLDRHREEAFDRGRF